MQELQRQLINYRLSNDINQQTAIMHGMGPMLVTAGPGSGKTLVITQRIQSLIQNFSVDPGNILVITFTKSAAIQMKQRFQFLAGMENCNVRFGTFHAVFFQIIKQSGLPGPIRILKTTEKIKILRIILKEKHFQQTEEEFILELLKEFSSKKNLNEFHSSLLESDFFEECLTEYQKVLQNMESIDFDDMLIQCYEILKKNKDIRSYWQKQFTYILIDEFQDINPIQYNIIKILAGEKENIFAVGDEDQAIYSFRGSSPGIMFSFLKDFHNVKQVTLAVNYRSRSDIVSFAGRLIQHNKNRFDKHICAQKQVSIEDGVQRICFHTQKEQNQFLCDRLSELKERKNLSKSAIIYRTNALAEALLGDLNRNQIPYHYKEAGRKGFESILARDIFAYFELACGQSKSEYLYRIMNKPLRYLPRSICNGDFFEWKDLISMCNGKQYLITQIEKLRKDISFLSDMCPYAAISFIRKYIGYDQWILSNERKTQSGIEKDLEEMNLLMQEAKRYETYKEWKSALELQKKECISASEDKSDTDRIEIVTMHAAKGLEWENVFLPDVIEGVIPHKRAKTIEEVEEERRMFYVALTRAKEKLYVFSIKEDGAIQKNPSRFFLELEGE